MSISKVTDLWKPGFKGHSMHKREGQPVIEILMFILCLFRALVRRLLVPLWNLDPMLLGCPNHTIVISILRKCFSLLDITNNFNYMCELKFVS